MKSSGSRSSRVRTKVVALLVSLAALWAFAAFVTLREGINLLFVSTMDNGVAKPLETLVPAMQEERRSTLVYLGGDSAEQRQKMLDQRALTDQAAKTFRELSSADSVRLAASPELIRDLDATYAQLDSITTIRADIDGGRVTDRLTAAGKFTGVVDTIFQMYGSLGELDDKELARDVRTLIDMTQAREVLSQEDGLVAGALAARTLTDAERAAVPQLVGTQEFLRADAASRWPDGSRQTYDDFVASDDFSRFELMQSRFLDEARSGKELTISEQEWTSATQPVFAQLQIVVRAAGESVIARATPVAVWVVVRLALAGGLGLLAVIASIIVSITTARNLIQQLEKLRNAASELASYRLPRMVERLQHGEKVDVDTEAPPLDFGRDEIGQVGQAFNDVQSTAVRVAVEQAELRRSVRDVFLSLARRSQALLHRQLGLLDAMERRATDAEELAELFRIDHLATRMRRNAENLIVLSGATAGRAWRKPVPIVDVLRGALAEVEDYTRVTVLPVFPASLVGRAVGDVIHLLAELIENAVSFSPPQTVVRVGGSVVGNGFAIEIEDRGLGMSFEDRALANEQLNDPPEFKLSSTARLGLYVVGKLAERHGIRVKLTESPYGGTTAIVLLPATLMADGANDGHGGMESLDATGVSPWTALAPGRHRNDANSGQPITPAGSISGPGSGSGSISLSARTAAAANQALSPPAAPTPFVEDLPLNGSYSPPAFVTSFTGEPSTGTGTGTSADTANGMPASAPDFLVDAGSSYPGAADVAPTSPVGPTVGPTVGAAPAVDLPGDRVPSRGEPTMLTPSGLPFRQREKLAAAPPAQVAADALVYPTGPVSEVPPIIEPDLESPSGRTSRPPEEVRNIMASYRSGTLRGRIDAARLSETNHAPEWTDMTQESHRTDEEG